MGNMDDDDQGLADEGETFKCECTHNCGLERRYIPGRRRGHQRRKAAMVCDLVQAQLDAAVALAMAAPDDWNGREVRELVADMASDDAVDGFRKTPRGRVYQKTILKDPPGLRFPPHRYK